MSGFSSNKPLSDSTGNFPIQDGPAIDAFSKLRTSAPTMVFDSVQRYNKLPLIWGELVFGSATSTHDTNISSVRMVVGTDAGDRVIRQTHKYFRYQPGLSQVAMFTGALNSGKQGLRQCIGLFDGYNGLFFQQQDGIYGVVKRSTASGSDAGIDTLVEQSDWNLDKMDGTGPSGIVINETMANIYFIDYEWLGSGRVRFGFIINGILRYCHEMIFANNLSEPYMSTPHLPLRYEIENTSVTASGSELLHICSSVFTEGDVRVFRSTRQSVNNGVSSISVTSRRAVLSIRSKGTFNGIVNRATVLISSFSAQTATNNILLEIIKGHVLGGPQSWSSVGNNSTLEIDVSGTTITGGDVLLSRYITSSSPVDAGTLRESILTGLRIDNGISLNFDGTHQILSIVATAQTGTADVLASLDLDELY